MREVSSGEKKLGPLKPGDRFGDCTVERLLGQGSMGFVYLVRAADGVKYALKVMSDELAKNDPTYKERFLREAEFAMKIHHRNLIPVHDAGYDAAKGVYFLVMDYVKGDTLRSTIAFGGAQPEKEAVRIILQIADVLAAAQRFGMVHRDLKPENIMLTPEGNVKLLDLGVAKISGGMDSLKTTAKTVFGTPAYISPEQAVDSSTVDARADVYSLGVILFEMLCGRRPYSGETPLEILPQLLDESPVPDVRTFNPGVSQKLSDVLARMCAKKKENRLASPKDVIAAFARIGYTLSPSGDTEYAAEEAAASSGMVQDLIPDVADAPRDGRGLNLETQDKDVQEFLAGLRRKKLKRKLLWALLAVSLLVVLLLVRIPFALMGR